MPPVDPGRRTLVYASAGHTHGFVQNGSGATCHTLSSTSPPLGLFSDAAFPPSDELPLAAGDLLLLVTDGVTEAQSRAGELFGAGRALRCVAESGQDEAARIVKRLFAAVSAFAPDEPQHDDITAVVCRVLP
jgi:sigma-B regulation protein RsbU (phosphoserine phosphatase)